jgi:hypothetical protein
MGIRPTGRRIEYDSTEVYRIQDGRIAEESIRSDTMTLLNQLGGVSTTRLTAMYLSGPLLPTDEAGMADARVALAFLSYAATRPRAAVTIEAGNARLRRFLADQLRAAQTAGGVREGLDADQTATALLALTDGLAVHVMGGGLSVPAARAALVDQLDGTFSHPAGNDPV